MPAPTVTQQMMVEVDGSTDALQAKLELLERKIDQLQQRGSKQDDAVSQGAQGIGDRYAYASTRIASATEQMSRMGEVGGRGLRQLLQQGGEMAFMFGPTGAIIGALAVFAMAIEELFSKSAKKMSDEERQFFEGIDRMVKSKDLLGLSAQRSSLYSGEGAFAVQQDKESATQFRARQIGISGSRAKIAQMQAQIDSLKTIAFHKEKNALGQEVDAQNAGDDAQLAMVKIRALRGSIDDWTIALNGLEAKYNALDPAMAKVNKAIGDEAAANLKQLQQQAGPQYASMIESAKKALEGLGNSGEQALAGQTKSAVDNAVASIHQYEAQVRQAIAAINEQVNNPDESKRPNAQTAATMISLRGQIEAQAAIEIQRRWEAVDRAAEQEARDLIAKVEGSLGTLTGSLGQLGVDAIKQQNDQLRSQIVLADGLDDATKLRLLHETDIKEMLERQAAVAKDATADVDRIINTASLSRDPNTALTAINDKAIQLQQTLAQMVLDGGEQARQGEGYKQIVDAILKLDKQRADLLAKMLGITKDDADGGRRRLKDAQDTARAIQTSVDGAVQLAQAFGLVDQRSGSVLRQVGAAAANIPVLIAQLNGLDRVDAKGNAIGTLGGVLGAALPIAGAVAGIVGLFASHTSQPDPLEQEHIKAIQDNSKALQDLTKHAGFLGSGTNVNPTQAAHVLDIVSQALAQARGASGNTKIFPSGNYQDAADIQAVAKSLGITIDGTVASYQQLMEALSYGIPLLGKFDDDFASMMNEIDAESKIFGDQGPLADLAKIIGKIGPMSAGIASIFQDIDTSKALTPDEIALIRQRVQDLFKAMEGGGLSTDQLGILNGDDFLKLLEQIIGDLNALGPAAQTAADKLNAAQNSVGNDLSIYDIKDPTDIFKRKTAAYAGAIGGDLGKLLASFTGTSPDDIAQYNKELQDFFEKLKNSPDSVDTAGLSIDDLIKILLDLHGAADNVAAGVQSAVDKMNAARSQLDTDFQVYGISDPTATAEKVVDFYKSQSTDIAAALDGIDVSTEAGRAAADQALQNLYSANRDNADLTKEILDLLQHLRAVPGAGTGPGAAAGAQAAAGASSTALAQDVQQITVAQADRLLDSFQALLATVREFELGTFDRLDKFLALAASTVITAPQIPAGLLGLAGVAGSGQVNIEVHIEQVFNAPVGQVDKAAAAELAQLTLEMIDRGLNDRYKLAQLRAGKTMQS